jgi:hypothetical protein
MRSGISNWITFHSKLIIPLLGDKKIRDKLDATHGTRTVQPYEKLRNKPSGFAISLIHSANSTDIS